MAMVGEAKRQARRAANSSLLEWPTRIGFIGYGVLHLAVAWLGLQVVLGHSRSDNGQTGAFRTVAAQPLGRFLLIVTIVGLFAMAVWQLLLAAIGHQQEQGWHRPAERLASLGRVIIYTALALTAWQVLKGTAKTSAKQQQDVTAGLLHKSFGQVLVVFAGVLIVALGVGIGVYGAKKMFVRRLMTERMSPGVR